MGTFLCKAGEPEQTGQAWQSDRLMDG